MEYLRHARVGGKSFVQAPVLELSHKDGRRATLALTAHLGDKAYFEAVRRHLEAGGRTVFYEGIQAREAGEAHWRDGHHRFLRRLREDLYRDLAGLRLFTFQADVLTPGECWKSADVDCCEFAAELRRRGVRTIQYELALSTLQHLVRRAKEGSAEARVLLGSVFKIGLAFVSILPVLEATRFLPNTSGFHNVAIDFRNERAAKVVLASGADFALVYGAGHGAGLMSLLTAAGFKEESREWLSVFSL